MQSARGWRLPTGAESFVDSFPTLTNVGAPKGTIGVSPDHLAVSSLYGVLRLVDYGKSPVPIELQRSRMLWNSLKNNRDNEQNFVEWASRIQRKHSVVMAPSRVMIVPGLL